MPKRYNYYLPKVYYLFVVKVERDRTQLLVQTIKELNTQYNLYNRRASNTPPLAVSRVKVTFKDEPGEGTGVARSFYTAIAEVSDSLFFGTILFVSIINRFIINTLLLPF